MILWKDKELRIWTGDIETLASLTSFGFYNSDTEEWKIFEISEYKNELNDFVKFYGTDNIDYVCGFNYRNFDAQIIQYILDTYWEWRDLSNLEICELIYIRVQDLIDDQKYHLSNKYYENQFTVPVIDVYLINGLDNDVRRTSLKAAAFQTDGTVEEMPFHHSIKNITQEQIKETLGYMINDIKETYRLLLITTGKTELKSYKEVNQLELRIDIQEEFGLNCLNLSDIKLGEELLKLSYSKAIGKEVKQLPRKGTFRKQIKLKFCLPDYIKFQTKQLQDLHKSVKSTVVTQDDKLENKFKFYKTEYVQGFGGLHSSNFCETWEAKDDYLIESSDVSSYYPAIIVNNGYYPFHLGKELLQLYTEIYKRRLELKPFAKKDKKIKGITEALKIVLNVVFGKMGSKESWLYDKAALLSVTLTGQFSLLMLIEMLELEGIRVISSNSDGIETYFHKDLLQKKNEVIKKWESITNYVVETKAYKKFVYSTVNDYIAIDDKDEVKRKGDYEILDILWKNKSFNIIPLALEQYFIKGIKPEDFIPTHTNIYDFCARAKSNSSFHFEGINKQTGDKSVYNKLIRYYICKNGEKLLKIKNESCDTNAAKQSEVNAGKWISKVCNIINKEDVPKHLENLDMSFYIEKTKEFIYKTETGKKRKVEKYSNPQQISLF